MFFWQEPYGEFRAYGIGQGLKLPQIIDKFMIVWYNTGVKVR